MSDTEDLPTGRALKFADLVLSGMCQRDAYRAAGYKSNSDAATDANASALVSSHKVAAYLAAKRQKASQKAEIDLTWLIEECADLYAECRAEADRANAGANIQRLAQLTGNWLDRKETTVIHHEDRLDRIRQRLNDIPTATARPVRH